jgi:glyoxylase-like metal-dependent hydrolase (beta-lactamase superfamily II)
MVEHGHGYHVHTYTAGEAGLFVNSYLVESAEGVVLVDASLLQSDVRALGARLAALHKPLLGVFVTHAHPDHFNGLPLLASPDVPVYAAAEVADTIAQIADAKRAQWQPMYGAEWPDTHRIPDRRLSTGDVVELGSLRFQLHSVGPAESHADSYLTLDDRAFIGDLARLAAGAPTLTDAQREDLTAVMTSFLPQAPLTWMIGLGADAVAAELVAEAVAA